MSGKFDILKYMSGLTAFVFDKDVLERIALERGVSEVESFTDLDFKTRDLLNTFQKQDSYLCMVCHLIQGTSIMGLIVYSKE